MEPIVNKVAESGLISFDPAQFYHTGERVVFDIKDLLFQGLILREKDLREFCKTHNWEQYAGKNVSIICSADAIVPTWAYMLLARHLQPHAHLFVFGNLDLLEHTLFMNAIAAFDWKQFENERVVIKGCGEIPVPDAAYVEITRRLQPYVKSIMYGEPCSTVPIYKMK